MPKSALEQKIDDLDEVVSGSVDDLMKTFESLNDRIDAIELAHNRPRSTSPGRMSEERKNFARYLRHGDGASEVVKALTVSDDPGGGYLAPAEMSTEFIRDLVEASPMRSIASVRTIVGASVKYPRRTAATNAQWEGEGEDAEESSPTFGQVEIPARKLTTYVDLSNELLADSDGTAESEVRLALAEDFGKKEGAAFVDGAGAKDPEGFMTNADIAHTVNGSTSAISADKMIDLMYALPAAYRNAGTWTMNGTTLAAVRKLKDGQNNYLWQPAFQLGQPETILGRPVTEMVDMPDIASGAFPIAFGDFSAYRIVDRLSLAILVNPFLLATKGLTRIHATRRVGGKVLQAARFRKLKMSTS